MEKIVYEEMRSGEESSICDLVAHVFNEFIALDYTQEGMDAFFRFANSRALADRVGS